jgi:hypothetical protein
LAFANKLDFASITPPLSLRLVAPRHIFSPDRCVCARWIACDGPLQPLAARFCCAVNSKPGPKRGQEGNDAESGRILEPALRIHAG